MRTILLTLTAVILMTAASSADPGDTLWTRTYGGSDFDYGYSVRQTDDGGYIIGGTTKSFGAGNYDLYLVKTDADGGTVWTHTYGGSNLDYGYSVRQTSDGGYIFAGRTKSFGAGDYDVYLVRTDADGDTVWTRTYGGGDRDQGEDVQQTDDGGFIIAGYSDTFGAGIMDFYLVKTDANGNALWTRAYGSEDTYDCAYSVCQTADGGYIIAGKTDDAITNDTRITLVRTDSNGSRLWIRGYGGDQWDEAFSVDLTSDGGYIVGGYTESFGAGSMDFYLLKTDSNGDTIWTRTYGGGGRDEGQSVQQTADGGYVIAGYSWSYGAGQADFYIVKTDADGDTVWTRTYGGSRWDYGYSVHQTDDGGYILAGYTDSFGAGNNDIYLVRVTGQMPEPAVSIDMIPDNPPVTVPAGGSFTYTGMLANNTDEMQIVDVGIFLDVPGIGLYGPLDYYLDVRLRPDVTISIPGIVQEVPRFAPLGTYEYIAYCGEYPVKMDSASFEFTVTAPITAGSEDWNLHGWFEDRSKAEIPSEVSLFNNYPNPFNAETIISFDLPEAGRARLEVYNLMGQKVETLVDGLIPAGHHNVNWDASNYSSGIYFYKLAAGGRVFARRMTLVK